MRRAPAVIALGLVTVLGGAPPARAQERSDAAELAARLQRSHTAVRDDSLSTNPGETLLLRYLKAQQAGLLWEQYEQIRKDPLRFLNELRGGQSAALEKLATGIRKGELRLDKDDPLIRDLVKQFAQSGDDQALINRLPQELRQPIEDLLRRGGKPGEGSPEGPSEGEAEKSKGTRGASEPATAEGGGASGDGGSATNSGDGDSRFAIWLRRQVQALALNDSVLRSSNGLRQALDEVIRARLTRPSEAKSAPNSLGAEFSRWAGRAVPREFLSKLKGLGLEKIPWPSLGALKLPDLRSGATSSWSGAPNVDVPTVNPRGVGGVAVAATVLALALAWLLGRREAGSGRRRSRGRDGRPFKLGAWPVRPAQVTTPEDVIKSFEYVSVLRLGPSARTWNHRAIADRLGAQRPETGRAADELADRYEDARYAAEPAPLSPADVAAVRRHLVLVAGEARA